VKIKTRFFYRYDPLCPDGRGSFKNENGLIFFMNILSSNWKDKNDSLKFPQNFGSYERKGVLLGKKGFEALILDKDQLKHMPVQDDSHNCAFAVAAAVGVIVSAVNKSNFAEIFGKAKGFPCTGDGPENSKERQITFSGNIFDIGLSDVTNQTWLSSFRSEWLALFDNVHTFETTQFSLVRVGKDINDNLKIVPAHPPVADVSSQSEEEVIVNRKKKAGRKVLFLDKRLEEEKKR